MMAKSEGPVVGTVAKAGEAAAEDKQEILRNPDAHRIFREVKCIKSICYPEENQKIYQKPSICFTQNQGSFPKARP